MLGAPVAQPFGIAPTGFTRMMQTEGEIAGAHAAAQARHPVLAVHHGHHVDRGRQGRATRTAATGSSSTCGRTATGRWRWSSAPPQAGFDTLLVTVDVPVAGARLRDKRNGLSIPPQLTLGTVVNALPAAGVVDQLPHHRAAGLRLASTAGAAPSANCSTPCSTPP